MSNILSVGDAVARINEVTELVSVSDPVFMADVRFADAVTRLSRVIETARLDGMVVTGEIPQVVVDPEPGEQVIR